MIHLWSLTLKCSSLIRYMQCSLSLYLAAYTSKTLSSQPLQRRHVLSSAGIRARYRIPWFPSSDFPLSSPGLCSSCGPQTLNLEFLQGESTWFLSFRNKLTCLKARVPSVGRENRDLHLLIGFFFKYPQQPEIGQTETRIQEPFPMQVTGTPPSTQMIISCFPVALAGSWTGSPEKLDCEPGIPTQNVGIQVGLKLPYHNACHLLGKGNRQVPNPIPACLYLLQRRVCWNVLRLPHWMTPY